MGRGLDYRVVDIDTQKKRNLNKRKHKKELKKCEKRLIRTLNSLTRLRLSFPIS